ncbi:hypothetical protein EC968_002269 [Mortierella alpina]|nr:hypothetical protein EC968_002269 [Mortierella alpina]
MLTGAAHTFFSIPELVILLSAHVTIADLARCMLVCKDWSRHFEPLFWRSFRPTEDFANLIKVRPQVEAALIRNLRHIRTVAPFYIDETLLQVLTRGLPQQNGKFLDDPDALCTNLRRIYLNHFFAGSVDIFSQHLDTLLCHNHRLTHLAVQWELLDIDNAPSAISTLRHLQHLTIRSILPIQDSLRSFDTMLILKACLPLPELTELLFVDVETFWDDDDMAADTADLETVINDATIARFAQTHAAKKIKSIKLPGATGTGRNTLPLLLLKSDLLDLEACEIPLFGPDVDIDEIEKVVRERCPSLRHLRCPFLQAHDVPAVKAFIRGCYSLQSFTSTCFSDSDADSLEGEYYYGNNMPRRIVSELVSRHHSTLEVFDITESSQVFSSDMQQVLARCKKLKRFYVMCQLYKGSMSAIVSMEVYKDDWACMELRELGLTLNLHPADPDMYTLIGLEEFEKRDKDGKTYTIIATTRGEAVDLSHRNERDSDRALIMLATKRVYNQIGRLEKLEELTLDADESFETCQKDYDDGMMITLTLLEGSLGELAGLKNLRRLKFRAYFWYYMGQSEVEFMHKHWPLLSEITFSRDPSEIYHRTSHWQWLQAKRPYLRFKYFCT